MNIHLRLKKNYINPVTRNKEQYRLNIYLERPNEASSRQRLNKHRASFRPNFIHSVDAAIMRQFISEFYKKTKKNKSFTRLCYGTPKRRWNIL